MKLPKSELRWIFLILILSILSFVLAGYYQSELILRSMVNRQTMEEIRNLRMNFLKTHKPDLVFSFQDVAQIHLDENLVTPSAIMPKTHEYPYDQMKYIYNGMETCRWEKVPEILQDDLKKAMVWHQYLCGQIPSLPPSFFETRPLFHPMGSSYVYLAWQTGRQIFRNPAWISVYKSLMHLSELSRIRDRVRLSSSQDLASRLEAHELEQLLSSSRTVASSNWLFFRVGEKSAWPVYFVFSMEVWDQFLAKSRFFTSKDDEGFVIATDGNMSWKINTEQMETLSRRYQILGIVSFLFVLSLLAWVGIQGFRRKILDQQERIFILRTLTHELRTPVASMQLNLEPFRKEFDHLPQAAQVAFLRMTDGIRRLNRVIEASTQYLKSDVKEGVRFQNQRVDSVNDFVEQCLEDWRGRVGFVPLPTDIMMDFDTYWVSMCLKNLVDNGFKHGVAPVMVRLRKENDKIIFEVEDQGCLSRQDFFSVLSPFSRKSTREGLGLGLSLVKKIVEDLGGEMKFLANPTRISIVLKIVCSPSTTPV